MKNLDFNKRFEIVETFRKDINPEDITSMYGEGHLVNRLYIHWDLLTECNFDCSYCYAKRDYTKLGKWQKRANMLESKLIIEAISRAQLPVFLGLLGGEPTIHPNFKEICDLIFKKIIIKHVDNRLYITSNMCSDIFKKIDFYNGTKFLCSLHPEHEKDYGENYLKFLENVEYLSSRGFECKINLMLIPNKKYIEKIHKVYERLKNLDIQIHPHFMFKDSAGDSLLFNYDNYFKEFEYMRECSTEFIFTTKDNVYKFSDFEIFEKKLNNFKGFKCFNNNFEITFDGFVQNVCSRKSTKLSNDLNYFKKISNILPMICPYDVCNCDGMLKIFKEKQC